jgi:segregation and condensation protein B
MSPTPDNDVDFDDDIESAYRRALAAMAVAEVEVGNVLAELSESTPDSAPEKTTANPDDKSTANSPATELVPEKMDEAEPVSSRQVIEAVLFVGGEPITAKKLCTILRGEFQPEHVNTLVDELNDLYTAEQRPYEIRLLAGGYQIKLRPEFDPVRRRVFGMGAREVKLSQDALEILALVAYEQPISRAEIEKFGKKNASGLLSQLVRRELLEVNRIEGGGKKVTYRTTSRFLSVFGIGHPDELPQMDALQIK